MLKIKKVLTKILTSQFLLLIVTPHPNWGYLKSYQQMGGMSSKHNKKYSYSFMDQIFSTILTNRKYNIYYIYKTFELKHANAFKQFNKHFHIYKNYFISIPNQIHFNCFHYGYQIPNSAHLSGTLQIGG